MALTSVVPPFLAGSTQTPHQFNEHSPNSLNTSQFSIYPAINIPPNQHVNMIGQSDSSTAGLLIQSTNGPPLVQNGYLPVNNLEPYRFVQQTLNTMIGAVYPALLQSGQPQPQAHSCLLPTPVQPGSTEQGIQVFGTVKSQSDHNGSDHAMPSDDGASGRLAPAQSETSLSNGQSFVLTVRLLMSGKEVGSIIGKRGENVKKYREESGAKINISDGSSPERIVTVTGTSEQIFRAFSLMCQKFEDDFTQGLLRIGDEGMTCPPVTLRLLVPATQCGSIIGKGGSRIKDVRELTGASIQVASEALPASTERTVTISGTAKAIAKCIRYLCDIFIESPVKGPVSQYRPRPAYTSPSVLCTNPAYPPQVLHPNMVYSTPAASETVSEHGLRTNGNLMALTSTTPVHRTNESAALAPTQSSIGPAFLGPYNIGSDGSSFGISHGLLQPCEPGPAGQVISSGRSSTVLTDLFTDPMSGSPNLAYSDFASCHWPLLNPSQFVSNLMQGNVISPLSSAFVFPEISLNPSLLYTPPSMTALGQGSNVIYAGMPSILRSVPNGCSKDDNSSFTQQSIDNVVDTQDLRSIASDKQEFYQTAPFIPTVQSSAGYSLEKLNGNTLYCNSLPFTQNKASILGVPTIGRASTSGMPLLNGGPFTNVEDHVMKEMIISNDLIGCIIGRGGTTVNEIRSLSKAQVKISNCEDGAKERKITLSGTSQSVNLAHFLINNSIAACQQAWAFNVALASAVTAIVSGSGADSSVEFDQTLNRNNLETAKFLESKSSVCEPIPVAEEDIEHSLHAPKHKRSKLSEKSCARSIRSHLNKHQNLVHSDYLLKFPRPKFAPY